MIRRFYLINGNGDRYDLNEIDQQHIMVNPSGLGLSVSLEGNRFGNRNIITKRTVNLPTINGDILFLGNNAERYEAYQRLVAFLVKTPITLAYVLPNGKEYTIGVDIVSLSKSESERNGTLRSQIQMNANSLWRTELVNESFSTSAVLSNNGDIDCGIDIRVEGSLEDPYVIFRQNGKDYGQIRFKGEFTAMQVVSFDGEQNIILEDNGAAIANPVDYQDMSYMNGTSYMTFVKLPIGTSEIEVGGGTSIHSEIRYYEMRLAV